MTNEIDYSKTAWGDESVRISAIPAFYAMAACVISDNSMRLPHRLEALKPPSAKKLHWRELDDRNRRRALEAIADDPPSTTIVVAAPIIRNKQERARRKCLETLLVALEDNGIEKLILESRDEFLDRKDMEHILALRRSNALQRIEIYHSTGAADSSLYLPDQILGAYGDSETSDSSFPLLKSWKAIKEHCTFFHVTP